MEDDEMLEKEIQSIRDKSKQTGEEVDSSVPPSASRSRKETKTETHSVMDA